MENFNANTINHRELLAKYLTAVQGGMNVQKKIAATLPKELEYEHADKMMPARELLQTESIESTQLIYTELYQTAIQGAEPLKCWRNVLPILKMNQKALYVTVQESGTYAGVVAEGAEIPDKEQDYSSVLFTAKKYATKPRISKELLEDSIFDVIALEVEKAGARVENALNRAALDAIMGSAASNTDFGGSGANVITNMSKSEALIAGNGFIADKVVLTPALYGVYRGTLAGGTDSKWSFDPEVATSGNFPQIMGLPIYRCGATATTATNWQWSADNNLGGVVLASNAAGAIGMRRDLTVEQFNDPIRDLITCSVTMRFDVQALNTSAYNALQY